MTFAHTLDANVSNGSMWILRSKGLFQWLTWLNIQSWFALVEKLFLDVRHAVVASSEHTICGWDQWDL